MIGAVTLLLLLALVGLLLAGFSVSAGRAQFGWLGLACVVLAVLLQRGVL